MDNCVCALASNRLRRKLGNTGANVHLAQDLRVDFAERICIGDWVYVGPGCQFYGRGGLTIADHVIVAPQVIIMTSMHNYKNARFIPYDEIELLNPVAIGVASWIGFGAIILPGVVLGKGCIVGAGSVVTKSFSDGFIVAGNPARIIGKRDMQEFSVALSKGGTYLKNKLSDKLQKIERMATVRKSSPANQ